MRLEKLRNVVGDDRDISFDGSRPLFRVGTSGSVSDLMMAIPMLKADPVIASAPTGSTATNAFTMKVSVQLADTLTAATYYDNLNANSIAELTAGLATQVDFRSDDSGCATPFQSSTPSSARATRRGTSRSGVLTRPPIRCSVSSTRISARRPRRTSRG